VALVERLKELFMKKLIGALLMVSSLAFAAPPAAPPASAGAPPARWDGEHGGERKEEMQKKIHMMLVVGIADAMGLNETEALRMSDKLKVFEDKRRPVREAMGDAMRTLKQAADGDSAAGAQVDAAVQKVLDGRQQMAALDKEMFQGLSKDLTPQRRAQLAIFLARFHAEQKFGKGGGGGGGRRHGGR
jgi:Spy/CpxP family protein refolding chaperone